tara:strand:+ start:17 stop:472 length:456 start_codon:yes stop_codon:yes gene_type:complete
MLNIKKTNNLRGESMITLTEKENKLLQYFLNNNDGTDCHIISKDWDDHKDLGWSFETLRGVFASIIDKGILDYVDENDNGEIYQFTIPVDYEQQSKGASLLSINGKYFRPFGNSEDWYYNGKELNITSVNTFMELFNEFNSKLEKFRKERA